jgi:microcystin-dependent protein
MTFIRKTFAEDGDKTTVPFNIDLSGAVSYEEGYGPDYELEQDDPAKRNIERAKLNQLLNTITSELRHYQTLTFPLFITSSDNNGAPFPYQKFAIVRFDDGAGYDIYESLIDDNETDPTNTTNWRRFRNGAESALPMGSVLIYTLSTLPDGGYAWLNGQTMGSDASGADLEGDIYQDLYLAYWGSYPNAILPILDSTGAASTRGVNALADWNANKRLPLLDYCGIVPAGKDDMGGITAKGRLTQAASGVNGTQLGATGGAQTVQLTGAQNGTHNHGGTAAAAGGHAHEAKNSSVLGSTNGNWHYAERGGPIDQPSNVTEPVGNHTHTLSISTSGNGDPHLNVQPTRICNYIVKL